MRHVVLTRRAGRRCSPSWRRPRWRAMPIPRPATSRPRSTRISRRARQDAPSSAAPAPPATTAGSGSAAGTYLLRINLTLQARYEWFDVDQDEEGRLAEFEVPGDMPPRWAGPADEVVRIPWPGGDLSGFSLPRATLKLSGEAGCRLRYYAELEFGDPGWALWTPVHMLVQAHPGPFLNQRYAYDVFREGVDRVRRQRPDRVPPGQDQDAEHASADGGPRAPAVRRRLAGLGAAPARCSPATPIAIATMVC